MNVTEEMISDIRFDMTKADCDRETQEPDWPEIWDSSAGYRYLAKRLNELLQGIQGEL